jgi:hypothetical protein
MQIDWHEMARFAIVAVVLLLILIRLMLRG